MLATIAPFWDGNKTWLVVIGASLFAAFPTVYSGIANGSALISAIDFGASYFPSPACCRWLAF